MLYVYGNDEGDVMNFDVAAEMAAEEGIEVRTVRTMDDVSLPKGDGRRGIAGSYFQVKIARRLRGWPQPGRSRARY